MSKKNNKSSVKKGKAAKPANKSAKKVFSNKKTTVKKAVKKPVPAKKAGAKKPVAAAKQQVKPQAKANKAKIAKKPVTKVVSGAAAKSAAKTISKPAQKNGSGKKEVVAVKTAAVKPTVKTPAKKQAAEQLSGKIAKTNTSSVPPAGNAKASGKTPVRPIIAEEAKTNDPPGKFELEYVVHSSAELLFSFLTEPSGLSEWFCDDVNIRHGIYTFFWDGSQQQAKEIKYVPDRLIRFHWIEKNDESYFEFRIEKDELTGDISLIITDFGETDEERKSSKLLWDSQIDKLLHVMGAYF